MSFHLVGERLLAPDRLLDSAQHYRFLELRGNTVLDTWLATAESLQRQLAAFVIESFDTIEIIGTKAHYLTGSRDITELFAQFQ